ncbi:MAG: nicotinamide mononucleotide transporter, partial [Arenicella sp.]
MQDLIVSIGAAWAGTSQLEIVSVLFGLVYVVLAARENIWCWPAAFIGTGTAVFLFWDASLVMESALNVYYLAMAIFGWWQWRAGGDNNSGLLISSLRTRQHLIAISLISVLTLVSGYLLSTRTTAALPYVDSFTTWSAV